ncbi:hypothetical protein ACFQGH_11490 [Halalkalicoccus tibetensis]|uniref:Tat (Twin-arginine translocation) pathway signal sequence n=2 Tax=Halalkalicoccus tibetensis TaxID=175632 RepID=A0ABD5V4R9_9EURY
MDRNDINRRQILSTAGLGIVGLGMGGRATADHDDPNQEYIESIEHQLRLRDDNDPNMDEDGVRSVLQENQGRFDGQLIGFAANDFGQPRVFLPDGISDQNTALQAIVDAIHEEKWRARNSALRDVRDQTFSDVQGVHQCLCAVLQDDGSADYDIDYPSNASYNFTTIREVIGLVDWMANADEQWLDGNRLTY